MAILGHVAQPEPPHAPGRGRPGIGEVPQATASEREIGLMMAGVATTTAERP